MKILLLIDSLVSGGRERRLIELIKGLRKFQEVQMKLVVFSDKIHYKEIYELGIPVIILKRLPKKNPVVFYRLFKICQKWKPDLIHSWGTMSAILAIPSSLVLNIKLINGNVTDAPPNMGFYHKELFRARLSFLFSSVVVGNSKAGLSAYKVPDKKAICIYNGFGFNRVSNLQDKNRVRDLFKISTSKVVGMVGGFFDRKDYDTYVKSALTILKQRTDVTFIAVGDGPNLMRCKGMIPSEYASRFVFTGVQTDVESIINIFDIGVLATNAEVHGEGISNAILEYMAVEKSVVATIGGGTDEIVVDNVTGILIQPGSTNEMTNHLIQLLDDNDKATKMGQAGRARVFEFFSLDKMTESYFELYQNLLKK